MWTSRGVTCKYIRWRDITKLHFVGADNGTAVAQTVCDTKNPIYKCFLELDNTLVSRGNTQDVRCPWVVHLAVQYVCSSVHPWWARRGNRIVWPRGVHVQHLGSTYPGRYVDTNLNGNFSGNESFGYFEVYYNDNNSNNNATEDVCACILHRALKTYIQCTEEVACECGLIRAPSVYRAVTVVAASFNDSNCAAGNIQSHVLMSRSWVAML